MLLCCVRCVLVGSAVSSDKKRGKWTAAEDAQLRAAVLQHKGKNWKNIAKAAFGDSKSDVQCLHRWQKVLDPKLVKGPWTKAEDSMVVQLVDKYGPKKWSTIAANLPGRIGKQCRERWHNHLNPDIRKDAWTQEEDDVILSAHKSMGNRWSHTTQQHDQQWCHTHRRTSAHPMPSCALLLAGLR